MCLPQAANSLLFFVSSFPSLPSFPLSLLFCPGLPSSYPPQQCSILLCLLCKCVSNLAVTSEGPVLEVHLVNGHLPLSAVPYFFSFVVFSPFKTSISLYTLHLSPHHKHTITDPWIQPTVDEKILRKTLHLCSPSTGLVFLVSPTAPAQNL